MAVTRERMLIGGEWVEAASRETFETRDPATGEVVAAVPRAGAADVDRAVAAARRAVEGRAWRETTPAERGRILSRIAAGIRSRADELARLETLDTGKPLRPPVEAAVGTGATVRNCGGPSPCALAARHMSRIGV